jgi:hypothetical protein
VVALFHVAKSLDVLSADLPTHHGATTASQTKGRATSQGGLFLIACFSMGSRGRLALRRKPMRS